MIRSGCQQFYFPASSVMVNEMMIRLGSCSYHTYRMPSKPITEGYKVFALCDIGYTFDWIFASWVDSSSGLNLPTELTPTSLPGTFGHFNFYMYSYFTYQQLLAKLRDLGIGGCGTPSWVDQGFHKSLMISEKTLHGMRFLVGLWIWQERCLLSSDKQIVQCTF